MCFLSLKVGPETDRTTASTDLVHVESVGTLEDRYLPGKMTGEGESPATCGCHPQQPTRVGSVVGTATTREYVSSRTK